MGGDADPSIRLCDPRNLDRNMSDATNQHPVRQDNYALNILTQAAMHTRQSNRNGNASGNPTEGSHSSQSRNQGVLDGYNPSMLSSCDLGALAFNTSPPAAGQHPYLSLTYDTIGSRMSMGDVNNLAILNAELYDDGRSALREERRTPQSRAVQPFGVTDHPRVRLDRPLADAEDDDSPLRRTKSRTENQRTDAEEETKEKLRGRPRVNPKDDTAADVRVSSFCFGYDHI